HHHQGAHRERRQAKGPNLDDPARPRGSLAESRLVRPVDQLREQEQRDPHDRRSRVGGSPAEEEDGVLGAERGYGPPRGAEAADERNDGGAETHERQRDQDGTPVSPQSGGQSAQRPRHDQRPRRRDQAGTRRAERRNDSTSHIAACRNCVSRHSATAIPTRRRRRRSISRSISQMRSPSAPTGSAGGTAGTGDTSTTATSKPRPRRSTSAATLLSSSSGETPSTSAPGGSVRTGTTSRSFHA